MFLFFAWIGNMSSNFFYKVENKRVLFFLHYLMQRAYLIAQLVKNPPVMQEIPVQFLGQEDPLVKG